MAEQVPSLYFQSLDRLWEGLQEKIPATKSQTPPGGLLKAAVVFIDMSGFSALTTKFRATPHASAFIAHHFLSLTENWALTARETINKIYLDKIVGDEIMLVIPGDRIYAVGAALQVLRQTMLGPGLYKAKAAIHWGEVWLGDIGLKRERNRMEEFRSITVMGDTVNIAARLMKLASSEKQEIVLLASPLTEPTLKGILIPSGFEVSAPERVDSSRLKGVLSELAEIHVQRMEMTLRIGVPGIDVEQLLKDYLGQASPPRLDL